MFTVLITSDIYGRYGKISSEAISLRDGLLLATLSPIFNADIQCPYRISRRVATADTAEHFITSTIRSIREPALRAFDEAKCRIHFPEAETFHLPHLL